MHIWITPEILEQYVLNIYKSIPVGIKVNTILKTTFLGKYMFRFGITKIILCKKYKKLAASVANPAPTNPIFGISTIFNTTPIMPEINLIINSI